MTEIEFELNLKDRFGGFVFPEADLNAVSEKDKILIREMVKVMSHERFNHGGFGSYDFYKEEVCYFILKLIRKS